MQLLEREALLQRLGAVWERVRDGGGQVVLVSGEAGIGKTSLVQAFVDEYRVRSQVLWGACDPLFTPRPLGPLHDFAPQLSSTFAQMLRGGANRFDIFSAFLTELERAEQPLTVVLEDVHWADEATFDLIKFVSRRVQRTRVLLILSFRDDELGKDHPLRTVLGDLTSAPLHRIQLPSLSLNAVTELSDGTGVDAAFLHQQTGGNPFYVTEVLDSGVVGIPPTVRDAVLARAARLSLSARAVLDAAAVIGPRVDGWLLEDIVQAEHAAVSECIATGIMRTQGERLVFRHEIARQTLLHAMLPQQRRMLHGLVLDALGASSRGQQDLARLAEHAEQAGRREAVLELAPRAAAEAAAAGAHREAVAQYARTLRFADGVPAAQRAEWLDAYAQECSTTDQHATSIDAFAGAQRLWHQVGNLQREGLTLALMSLELFRLGRNEEAEAASREAIDLLEALPPSPELARAYCTQSYLRMLSRDNEESVAWGEKASALARRFGATDILVSAKSAAGTALLFIDYERGCAVVEESIALAQAAGLDADVALGFDLLGTGSGELYQFERADRYLNEGLHFARDRDLDNVVSYMMSWQALTHLYQGRWAEAGHTAHSVLKRPGVAVITRIMALLALGRLRARRGDPGSDSALDEALELAEQTGHLQRIAPVRAARAEAAWLSGGADRAGDEAAAAYEMALQYEHPWFVGELAFWLWRAGRLDQSPSSAAEPFACHIDGDWRGAAARWEDLLCPYERATALAESSDEAVLKEALEVFMALDAKPAAELLRQKMRALGISGIPQGPRPSTLANPAGLTPREMDVLELLVTNLTNTEIAQRLFISAKTVEHHVSAILAKLDVSSRHEAASFAEEHALFDTK